MRELLDVWRSPRQTVLVALIAAVYAAVLIPFKFFPLIPGYTEMRPANAIPVAMSVLFGPAAAWGSAIGNLIGDLFGTLTLGSIIGFVGNFLYGLIPYKVWRFLSGGRMAEWQPAGLGKLIAALLLAGMACGGVIGWGVESFRIGPPFVFLGNVIVINNVIMSLVLSPLLLQMLVRPMREMGLTYRALAGPATEGRRPWHAMGFLLLVLGCVGIVVVCNLVGFHVPVEKYQAVLPHLNLPLATTEPAEAMGWAGAPFVILIIIGSLLL